jgi:Family of unknown function (DUF5367)
LTVNVIAITFIVNVIAITLTSFHEEIIMNRKDRVGFLLLGSVIWAVATSVYRLAGSYFFEGSAAAYWLNVTVSVILCVVLPLGLLKWRRIEQKDWLQAAICMALPGMLSEIPILVSFSELMSNMQPETAGRYAAYLFGCYSALIGSAWLISTKASLRSISDADLSTDLSTEQ